MHSWTGTEEDLCELHFDFSGKALFARHGTAARYGGVGIEIDVTGIGLVGVLVTPGAGFGGIIAQEISGLDEVAVLVFHSGLVASVGGGDGVGVTFGGALGIGIDIAIVIDAIDARLKRGVLRGNGTEVSEVGFCAGENKTGAYREIPVGFRLGKECGGSFAKRPGRAQVKIERRIKQVLYFIGDLTEESFKLYPNRYAGFAGSAVTDCRRFNDKLK